MTTVDDRIKGAELDAAELALHQAEQTHGRDNPAIVEPLNRLAEEYGKSGLCGKAELLYKRLVDIVSQSGNESAHVNALSKLAAMYRCEGKLDDAEAVYLKILSLIGETADSKRLTAEHLCSLAGVYVQKREWHQAENALGKAAQLFREVLGEQNNFASLCEIGLATLKIYQGKNGEADDHFAKSEKAPADANDLGTDQGSLIELAQEYFKQSRLNEVEMLLHQAIFSEDLRLWPEHPRVGQFMHDRGELFRAMQRYPEAEKAFKRALEIRAKSLGQAHPELAQTAMSLAGMYVAQGRFIDAEPILKQAMKTRVLVFGVEHPSVAAAIETYVAVLKSTKRQSIAMKLEARARDIRTKLVWESERAAAGGRPPSS